MAAALLTKETVTLSNVPKVRDTHLMAEILGGLGGSTEGDGVVSLNMAGAQASDGPADLGRRMRGTVLLLGALLGRVGRARLPPPGGDDIGAPRGGPPPRGLRQMGAQGSGAEARFAWSAAGRKISTWSCSSSSRPARTSSRATGGFASDARSRRG